MRLPENVQLTGKGGSPLGHLKDWCRTSCPACGQPEAQREIDTMDTFMDSSWYYWRYCSPTGPLNDQTSLQAVQQMLPVDVYIGGTEHAILHLLYARFIHKFLSERLLGSAREREQAQHHCISSEPFARLITQGLVEGLTYQCPKTGRYLCPEEIVSDPSTSKVVLRATGEEPTVTWTKMSKSKHNGVEPTSLVAIYGADVLRLCVLFKAPPEVTLKWNTRDIAGPQRWLVRLLNLAERIAQASKEGTTAVTGGDGSKTDAHHLGQFLIFLDGIIRSVRRAFDSEPWLSVLTLLLGRWRLPLRSMADRAS